MLFVALLIVQVMSIVDAYEENKYYFCDYEKHDAPKNIEKMQEDIFGLYVPFR